MVQYFGPRSWLMVTLALLTAPAVLAAAPANTLASAIHCMPIQELDAHIQYCTENTLAIENALKCAESLNQAWSSASKEVAQLFARSKRKESSNQQGQFKSSDANLQSAIDRMDFLVTATEQNADLLAQYPTVMADNPGLVDASDSLPCYTDAVSQIQKTVTSLDEKIDQGYVALEETDALQGGVKGHLTNLNSSSTSVVAHGNKAQESIPAKAVNGIPSRNPASDITGTYQEQK